MLSVPFSISDAHHGLSEMRGVVYIDGEEVVVEMQVKLFNLFKRPAQAFRFDVTDLDEVRHRRGVFSDSVTLRTRPMEIAAQIPGSADGTLSLKVRRRDRRAVDALLDRLDLWIV